MRVNPRAPIRIIFNSDLDELKTWFGFFRIGNFGMSRMELKVFVNCYEKWQRRIFGVKYLFYKTSVSTFSVQSSSKRTRNLLDTFKKEF